MGYSIPHDRRIQIINSRGGGRFDRRAALPPETTPLTGTWTTSGGKLVVQTSTSATPANARLRPILPTNALTTYSVKVQPDAANLLIGGEMLAGFTFGEDSEGRYLLGLRAARTAGPVRMNWAALFDSLKAEPPLGDRLPDYEVIGISIDELFVDDEANLPN